MFERCVGVARTSASSVTIVDIADLPTPEKLVEVCGKLLPVITKFFGLP